MDTKFNRPQTQLAEIETAPEIAPEIVPAQASERRDSQRLRTVYRVARVQAHGVWGLARVHNVSNEGLMLSTQLPIGLGSAMAIDLSETCTLSGHVAWHAAGRCGVKLSAPIDSPALLRRLYNEQQTTTSRHLRLPLEKAVMVTSELGVQIARARDISQRGIKLVHDGRFSPGLHVKVQITREIERRGVVRWSRDGIAGCILTEYLSVEDLGAI
ncbi:PilZ domain-containing protein [Sphingomonas glacialis]|uniref:PilZ domain-containing protein n=1 Tax=Sphingomonas glacialis TaxID=658225 RepID=A0A502G1A6_9SPHN|nr:PilZ domain-containing protein [Sphingomonas glacialis]TPG54873.1 PilZ domain-containing protein [Sphingomonas glacialis]